MLIWNSCLSGSLIMFYVFSTARCENLTTILLSTFGVQPLVVVAIPWDENNNSNSDF